MVKRFSINSVVGRIKRQTTNFPIWLLAAWKFLSSTPIIRWLCGVMLGEVVLRTTLLVAQIALASWEHILIVVEFAFAFVLLSVLRSRRASSSTTSKNLNPVQSRIHELIDKSTAATSTTRLTALWLSAVRDLMFRCGDSSAERFIEYEKELKEGERESDVIDNNPGYCGLPKCRSERDIVHEAVSILKNVAATIEKPTDRNCSQATNPA